MNKYLLNKTTSKEKFCGMSVYMDVSLRWLRLSMFVGWRERLQRKGHNLEPQMKMLVSLVRDYSPQRAPDPGGFTVEFLKAWSTR